MAILENTFTSRNTPLGEGSASNAFVWVPSDTDYFEDPAQADRAVCSRGISFDVPGAIALEMLNGSEVVIPIGTLAPGIIHPIKCVRILATGTAVGTEFIVWA